MFRNRNSQKPRDELIAEFKTAYPGLSSSGSRSASLTNTATAGPANVSNHQQLSDSQLSTTSLTDALDVAVSTHRQHHGDDHDIKDLDPTPRANADQWRFTPSLLDPNSFAFTSFANQPPGYYTPTPGGTNTIYHPQAGDLHTPGFTMGLGTPLSMPNSEGSGHVGQTVGQAFNPQALAQGVFHNANPFGYTTHQSHEHLQQSQHDHQQLEHPQTFAPHQFSHHPTFDHFHHVDESKMESFHPDVEMQDHSDAHLDPYIQRSADIHLPHGSQVSRGSEKYVDDVAHTTFTLDPFGSQVTDQISFRFHTTLNAPTAMIKSSNEIPITYLNKGQAYTIKIVDTRPATYTGTLPTYRTYLRISFEDGQQRQRPAQCWQLWKEGRGTTEAHHRGGRLQAVEFVDPTSSGTLDQALRPRIELESASFDGFAVKWSPSTHGPPECQVSLRFNFLSTDFSHSKGVKGIPVRLCSKTQLLTADAPLSPVAIMPEICFGKVKLFRDHGAERKLSNDIAHVKKSIDKLQQQISQLETGMKDFSKRKRSEPNSKAGSSSSKPGKVPKHKRTWSMSSASDAGIAKTSLQEDELQAKLSALQDMFSSTQPASVLFLKGEDADDADLNPVYLSTEPVDGAALTRVTTGESSMWEKSSTQTSEIVSPTPSQHSLPSLERTESSGFQQPAPFQPPVTSEWNSQTATADLHHTPPPVSQPDLPVKVQKNQQDNTLASWIEALGVDYTYQAPPERVIKPVAAFFIKPRIDNEPPKDNYYRAVYLMQRTLNDLNNGIAAKSGIEPSKILRTLRINNKGISIVMDDEAVVELTEGQDMVAEFQAIRSSSPMKREWDSGATDIQVDGDVDTIQTMQSEGYELRLVY